MALKRLLVEPEKLSRQPLDSVSSDGVSHAFADGDPQPCLILGRRRNDGDKQIIMDPLAGSG